MIIEAPARPASPIAQLDRMCRSASAGHLATFAARIERQVGQSRNPGLAAALAVVRSVQRERGLLPA